MVFVFNDFPFGYLSVSIGTAVCVVMFLGAFALHSAQPDNCLCARACN